MQIQPFTQGHPATVRKLNDIIRAVNALDNISGDGLVQVQKTGYGLAIGLNIAGLHKHIPRFKIYNEIYQAKTQAAAGAATTISCKLLNEAEAEVGDAITVYTRICGGGNLNAAVPRLASGDYIFVTNVGGKWYCTTVFQASEDCDCYSAP